MHIVHLSACCLQTFSDPLAVHTSLQFALYQTTWHQRRRDADIQGNKRLMVSRDLLLREDGQWERSAEKKEQAVIERLERRGLATRFFPPCKILSKEDWKESRWGERIYAVRDQGIKYNLKTTEGVYKILGYCNWKIICQLLFLFFFQNYSSRSKQSGDSRSGL